MKYSDDLYDVNHNIKLSCLWGIFCGIVSAIATACDIGAAYIFLAILIGNFLAFKIDGIHHLVTLSVFIIFCLIFSIPNLNLVILFICIFAALFDEVGHELISNVSGNGFLNVFFEYRFVMKIAVFLLAIFGAFNILIFIYFILFEIAYEMTGFIFKKFN